MTTSPPLRNIRFVVVAVCATLAAVGLSFLVFFVFPDVAPPTRFESFCTALWAVISWPLIVACLILRGDPPLVVVILLWIASGLFWAFVVELLLGLKRRRWPNQSLQATAAALVVERFL
jgi:hypothetical protein